MQLIELLPDHLGLSVLRAVPPTPGTRGASQAAVLAHMLHILPVPLHQLALRARFPSLDASGTLSLPPLPSHAGGSSTAMALRAAVAAGSATKLTIDSAGTRPTQWSMELPALAMLSVLRISAAELDGLSAHIAAVPALRCLHLRGSFQDRGELAQLLIQLHEAGGVTELALDMEGAGVGRGCRDIWAPPSVRTSPYHASVPGIMRRQAASGKHTLSRAARARDASQRVSRLQKASDAVALENESAASVVALPPRARSLHAHQGGSVTAVGAAAALAGLQGLTSLSIHSHVAGGSCRHLSAAVGQLTGLQALHLRGLQFGCGASGAGFGVLATSIGGLRQLSTLVLRDMHVDVSACADTSESGEAGGSAGRTCKCGQSHSHTPSPNGWAALGRAVGALPQLQTLRLRHCNVCECGLRSVTIAAAAAPGLHALEVCVDDLPVASMVGVLRTLGHRCAGSKAAAAEGLRWLRLGASPAQAEVVASTAEGRRLAAALAPLTALTHLALESGGLPKPAAVAVLQQLARLPALAEVHIVGCALTAAEMAALAPRFPVLRRLTNFETAAAGGLPGGRWREVWALGAAA